MSGTKHTTECSLDIQKYEDIVVQDEKGNNLNDRDCKTRPRVVMENFNSMHCCGDKHASLKWRSSIICRHFNWTVCVEILWESATKRWISYGTQRITNRDLYTVTVNLIKRAWTQSMHIKTNAKQHSRPGNAGMVTRRQRKVMTSKWQLRFLGHQFKTCYRSIPF